MLFDRPIGILTIACEASDQSELCQQAVIASIRNRMNSGRFESTIAGVCMQRFQYSEYLSDKGDNSNLERVLDLPDNAPSIIAASQAYDTVMAEPSLDPSQGATHFYADGIPAPNWATAPAVLAVKIGAVNFWKNVA